MGQGRLPGLSKLTPKQRDFLDEYLITGNATRSYKKIYPNSRLTTASTEGSKLVHKLAIPFETLAEAQGLTKGKILRKVVDKLDSKKIQTSPTEGDKVVDDNPSQLKAVEIAGKWLGVDKGTQVNVQVNIPILGGKSNL